MAERRPAPKRQVVPHGPETSKYWSSARTQPVKRPRWEDRTMFAEGAAVKAPSKLGSVTHVAPVTYPPDTAWVRMHHGPSKPRTHPAHSFRPVGGALQPRHTRRNDVSTFETGSARVVSGPGVEGPIELRRKATRRIALVDRAARQNGLRLPKDVKQRIVHYATKRK